jgi:hypothetical protein
MSKRWENAGCTGGTVLLRETKISAFFSEITSLGDARAARDGSL